MKYSKLQSCHTQEQQHMAETFINIATMCKRVRKGLRSWTTNSQ